MTLDQELAATLAREAGLRFAPPPDVQGIISGGRARRRRRSLARLGAVAAGAVLVGTTGYAVMQGSPATPSIDVGPADTPSRRSEPAPPAIPSGDRPPLEPGTYRMPVGLDASNALISADVTLEGPGWIGGDYPLLEAPDDSTHAGIGVYQPRALAAGTGCDDGPSTSVLGDTPFALAAGLADLPRGDLLVAPRPTQVLGLDAIHLRLRVDVDCLGYYRVADASGGPRGITYAPAGVVAPNVVIDFWVVDLGGTPVVIDQWREFDAPGDLIDMATAARKSITFVVSEN